MIRFDRRTLALGTLGLAGAAALAACHQHDSYTEPAPAAGTEGHAAKTAAAETAAPATDGAAAATAAVGLEWKDMNRDEREHYMKSVVLPKMKPAFAGWDPGEFGDIRCGTCHGAGARDKTFKMPNPKLQKLPAAGDEAGWKALAAREPEATKFMREFVVPTMAQMLGEKPYDPVTQQGFGCFECHTPKQ